MLQEIDFDTLPPSTNHSHGRNKWGGMYLKKPAIDFMTLVATTCRKIGIKKHTGLVSVEIIGCAGRFKNGNPVRMDMQNVEKLLFDSFQGFAYDDDKQVWQHTTTRVDGDKKFLKIIIKDYEPTR